MKVRQTCTVLIGAALILLACSAVSEARWFRGGNYYYAPAYSYYYVPVYAYYRAPAYSYYYVPSNAPYYSSTLQPSPTPAGSATPASSTATPYQANKPAVPAEPPLPSNSPSLYDASAATSGGQSVLPSSSWDYGRFPPYR